MFHSFDALRENVRELPKKTIAIAQAADSHLLELVELAQKQGVADFILVAQPQRLAALQEGREDVTSRCQVIPAESDAHCAQLAVAAVVEGNADVVMKGILSTADFMRAVLHRENGLQTGRLVSHVCLTEKNPQPEEEPGFHFITDCAMTISPTLEEKVEIVENAVQLAHLLGLDQPKVAVLSAVETVNPRMPESMDAAILSKMAQRGQISRCVIDGPLALDNAISVASAQQKSIDSPVAGRADILLMPNLVAGNILYKSLTYYANKEIASAIVGTRAPVVISSRSDSVQDKLLSLYLSVFIAELQGK